MDRGAWWSTVHGVEKSWTRLSDLTKLGINNSYTLIAQLVKNPPAMQDTLVRFLGGEDPLEKGQTTHSSIPGLPL